MKPKLLKLYLNNYGPLYGEHTFDLSDKSGVISVIGDNGAGKSTFLGAIPFCLYGEGKHDVLADLINTKALAESPDTSCEAALTFQSEAGVFVVARTINSRGKMTSRLSLDNGLLTRKSEEVDAKVLEIFNYTFKDLDYTLYCSQKNAAKFFNLKKNSEKKEFMYEMFNIESDEILEGIKQKTAKLEKVKDKIQSKYSLVSSLIKGKQDELTSIKGTTLSADDIKSKIDSLSLNKVSLVSSLDSKKLTISSHADNLVKLAGISSDISKTKTALESKTTELSQTKESMAKMESKIVLLRTQLGELKDCQKVKFDSGKMSIAETFISDLKTKISSNETLITSKSNSVTSLDMAIQELKLQAAAYSKSIESNECPVCKSKGVGADHIKSELSKINSLILSKQSELDSTSASVNTIKESVAKDKTILEKANEKYNTLVTQKKEYESALGVRKSKSKVIKDTRSNAAKIKKEKLMIENISGVISSHKDKIAQLESSAAGIHIPENLNTIKAEVLKIESDIKSIDSDMEKYASDLESIAYNKAKSIDLEKEIKSYELKKERYVSLNSAIDEKIKWVKKFRQICMTTFNDYINISISSIVNITNQFLNEMNSGLEMSISVEKDFNCNIYKDGHQVPFSLISGGLEILLGICFRLGVWRFIANKNKSNIPFLILDEVFGELSPAKAQILYSQVTGLKKYFDYIFITSHTDHVWQSDCSLAV